MTLPFDPSVPSTPAQPDMPGHGIGLEPAQPEPRRQSWRRRTSVLILAGLFVVVGVLAAVIATVAGA